MDRVYTRKRSICPFPLLKVKDRFEAEWLSASAGPTAGGAMTSLTNIALHLTLGSHSSYDQVYVPDSSYISSESKFSSRLI